MKACKPLTASINLGYGK